MAECFAGVSCDIARIRFWMAGELCLSALRGCTPSKRSVGKLLALQIGSLLNRPVGDGTGPHGCPRMRFTRLATSEDLLHIGKSCRISNAQFHFVRWRRAHRGLCKIRGISSRGLKFGRNLSIGSGALIRPRSYYSREIGMGPV
jgi:hypothetical protein